MFDSEFDYIKICLTEIKMGNRSSQNVEIELEDNLNPPSENNSSLNQKQNQRIPVWCSPLLLASLILLFSLVLFQFNNLPRALQTNEEVRNENNKILIYN